MIESISRYVAIGDSFTEGLWDPRQGPQGQERTDAARAPGSAAHTPVADLQRGWADLLAETISARRVAAALPPLEYANHAIRGKLLTPILRDQLPAALEQSPSLISIIGGANDLLRPGSDPDGLAADLEKGVIAARRTGARVLLSTGMDPKALPLVRTIREKVAVLNSHIWSISRQQGTAVLDMWGLRTLQHRQMWARDRIHLSPTGHGRVCQAALVSLGLEPEDPAWRDPLPEVPLGRIEHLRENGSWLWHEVAPWMTRRLRGRSSGDARTAKYPHPFTLERH